MRSTRFRVSVAAIVVSLGMAGCGSDLGSIASVTGTANAAAPAAEKPAAAPERLVTGLPDFTALVERYGPAVVNVTVVERSQTTANIPRFAPDDPFFEFFRRFGQPLPRSTPQPQPSRGQGSGFIVSPDGYILTNAHVVQGASQVTVKLTDRREYTAKVIGVDERTDVAVIKIDAQNLPTVKIGDPSKLKPGEWVIAIGSPFGFENSVTAGIVSATSRSMGNNNYAPFIQTDVAVNPGNSGGPLFNMKGEVVGINSQIYSRTGGYMGLSFAIPIDVANDVKEQLIATGKVTRSRIGVMIQDVDAQLAESFGLDRPRGALVSSVETDGPGDKAGIKPGDVILKVDGKQIETSAEVPLLVSSKKPGEKLEIEVWRNGSTKRLTARTEQLPEEGSRIAARAGEDASESKLGLAVRPLSSEEKRQAATQGSLLVEDVTGPAAEAGVQRGDIILGVNGTPVKSLQDLQAAVKKGTKVVALLIERRGQQIFIPVKLG
jgi:serine protease Do